MKLVDEYSKNQVDIDNFKQGSDLPPSYQNIVRDSECNNHNSPNNYSSGFRNSENLTSSSNHQSFHQNNRQFGHQNQTAIGSDNANQFDTFQNRANHIDPRFNNQDQFNPPLNHPDLQAANHQRQSIPTSRPPNEYVKNKSFLSALGLFILETIHGKLERRVARQAMENERR